jgi:hypothetical protein
MDIWWSLAHPDAAHAAGAALEEFGFPWVDLYPTVEAIIEAFESPSDLEERMSPAGPLDIADLYTSVGRVRDARSVLEDYVSSPVSEAHSGYLAEYLAERGHSDLVSQISAIPFDNES